MQARRLGAALFLCVAVGCVDASEPTSDETSSERGSAVAAGTGAWSGVDSGSDAGPGAAGVSTANAGDRAGEDDAGDSTAGAGGSRSAAGDAGGALAAAGAGDAGGADSEPALDEHCFEGITDYASEGPFDFEPVTAGVVKLWVPKVPEGCRVPVVHFANGTGAACDSYRASLEHLASHGLLVTCYENTATGDGTQCVTAVQTAFDMYRDLASPKVGFGGHQTGGGSAVLCALHGVEAWGSAVRIAGHASEPDLAGIANDWRAMYARVTAPIFLFNGSEDALVSESATREHLVALPSELEVLWYEGTGAPHIPVPTRWINESMVAWLRWKLLDDPAACQHLEAMPAGDDWDLQESRNPSGC